MDRRTGQNTRLIDQAVQDLFAGKKIFVSDHHEDGTSRVANRNLFDRICRRMYSEHRNEILIVNKAKLTIQIDRT